MKDDELWKAFVERTLPPTDWRHETHIRVAWMHLDRWALDEAHVRMRVGIIRLNLAHELEETADRGYHDTLTRFWLCAVAAARARDAEAPGSARDSKAFCEAHAELLDKSYPLRFYTRERLLSLQARAVMLAPDLQELPAEASLSFTQI